MKHKILIIEDELKIRESLQEILELNDYRVLSAANGAVGLELALEEMPDLIICDMMMPVMDGPAVLEAIKKTPLAQTPFIVLTAKAQFEDMRFAKEMGADDYVFKPFKSRDLVKIIEMRLNK